MSVGEGVRGGGDGGGSGTRVLLLLATNNADKAPRPAAFPHRLAMMYVFARDLAELLAAGPSPGPGTGMAIDIGVTTEPYFHSKSAAVAESPFYHRPTTGEEEKAPQLEPDHMTIGHLKHISSTEDVTVNLAARYW